MTKLEQLIEELCPNGVSYKELSALCCIETGKLNANAATENGRYLFFTTAKEISRIDSYRWDAEALLIAGNANVGDVKYYVGKFEAYQRTYVLTKFSHEISAKFLYYYLNNSLREYLDSRKNDAAMTYIVLSTLQHFLVPTPPLPVQSEIVRILDSFTELTAELTAELEAETIARGKQYEYYREELLKPKANIPMVTLGEIATDIYRGAGIKRDQVTEDGIPCVRYGEIYTTYNTWFDECVSHTQLEYVPSPKYFEHGDILFAITGESVEDIAKSVAYVGHERCLAGGDIVVLKHKQNPRYLAHVLATKAARDQKSKGKVKSKVVHSSVPSIEKITIPLPPLDVQARYADVLDNFEAICTDLNIGLPAEIAARQKQYEYYRDRLLAFKEIDTNGETNNSCSD